MSKGSGGAWLGRAAGVSGLVVPGALTLLLLVASHYPPRPTNGLPIQRDSGIFAYIGSRVAHGQVPVRDLWEDKPPGVFYLDALAFLLAGPSVRTLLGLDLIYSLVLVAAAAWTLRLVARPAIVVPVVVAFVLLYRHPNVLGGGNLTEDYVLLPMFLGFGFALMAARRGDREWLWLGLAGAAAGLAGLISLLGLTALPAVILSTFGGARGSWRRGAAVAAGFGLPVVCVLGAYQLGHGLGSLYSANVTYLGLYAPVWGRVALAASVAAAVAVAALTTRRLHPSEAGPAGLLAGVSGVIGATALLGSGHTTAHHLMVLLPPLTLALALTLEQFLLGSAARTRRGLAAGVLGVLLVVGAALQLVGEDIPSGAGLTAFATGRPVPPSPVVVALQGGLPPGCPVYVWGLEPALNFLSGHPSSGRYPDLVALEMPGYDTARRMGELLSDLRAAPPCAIVDASTFSSTPALDGTGRRDPSAVGHPTVPLAQYAPVMAWIGARYVPGPDVDGYRLWWRRA